MEYRRILLKYSGESLAGGRGQGIDADALANFAGQINTVARSGKQVAVVVGGGNIFRGLQGAAKGFDRVAGDQMGMLATVINSLALQSAIENLGGRCKVLTATRMEPVGEYYDKRKAVAYLEQGFVVIVAGGTGNPFFTTDSGAALRAVELQADALFKATRVDGIYTADPEKDPNATKYDTLTYDQAIERKLKVMDITAFALCSENHMPIVVFDGNDPRNIERLLAGEHVGTVVG